MLFGAISDDFALRLRISPERKFGPQTAGAALVRAALMLCCAPHLVFFFFSSVVQFVGRSTGTAC